ncbi:hypothetical protein F5Y03DRAFT_367929 [Xylaria venustula]|nr:hypothetical protein F5Y03DRAFT_367929 [Xylaria venustula]
MYLTQCTRLTLHSVLFVTTHHSTAYPRYRRLNFGLVIASEPLRAVHFAFPLLFSPFSINLSISLVKSIAMTRR